MKKRNNFYLVFIIIIASLFLIISQNTILLGLMNIEKYKTIYDILTNITAVFGITEIGTAVGLLIYSLKQKE